MQRAAVGEIAGVVLTAGAFMVFKRLPLSTAWFVGPCLLLWAGYAAWRVRGDRAVLRAWGIRRDNLWEATVPCLAFVVLAGLGMVGYRLVRGWRPIPLSFLGMLALYPFWGLLQQFWMQSLFAGNLNRLGARRVLTVAATAILFGIVHEPNWALVGLTLFANRAGAVWTILYLRVPNLIPIGLSHAALGTFAFYLVLGRHALRHVLHVG